jgi:CheY-like chemotaxis protein
MQAQLERSERMASLGTLAAGVAHEVNNPLASVIANLEGLAEALGPAAPSATTELLAEARDGAERVRDVVRGLRSFSSPGGGRLAVDVRSELEAAVRLARNEVRHRARLQVHLGPLPQVATGAHELGQVFLNLLVNAAQAIPEGHADDHAIRVEAGTTPEGWAMVEVRDSGAGIAPELLGRIFEPFFTTKALGVGTGLGLAIAHGLVTGAGGRMEVESQVGKGSTFRVLLPPAATVAAPDAGAPSVAGVQATAPRLRVLVVDDDPLVAKAAARTLARLHEVAVSGSAAAALARLEAGERFDVILCDLMMPQMTGMELHEVLRRLHPELADRVVFITGGAFTDRAGAFLREVPNACVEKPFDPAQLREVVAQAAQGHASVAGAPRTPPQQA